MKNLLLFLSFIICANVAMAQINEQGSSPSRKENRKAKKEREFQVVKGLLENRSFVLEADFLQDRYGRRIPVSHGINFVSVDSTEAIIQVGSNTGIGANGVGGLTAKGRITNWNLTENKKHDSFGLRLGVMTAIGMYDLNLTITSSGKATAELTGMTSGRLTFDGEIVSWENSTVYVGQSL